MDVELGDLDVGPQLGESFDPAVYHFRGHERVDVALKAHAVDRCSLLEQPANRLIVVIRVTGLVVGEDVGIVVVELGLGIEPSHVFEPVHEDLPTTDLQQVVLHVGFVNHIPFGQLAAPVGQERIDPVFA